MPIIATLHQDGRTIVKGTVSRVVAPGAQGLYVVVTFPELRTVEQILHIQLKTSPHAWVSSHNAQDKNYSGNTVGISMYLDPAAGTTLTLEAVAVGF